MARIEVDDEGLVWLVIVGGKRGDLAREREWQDAKAQASLLGVIDESGNQVRWPLPSATNPPRVESGRVPLSGPEGTPFENGFPTPIRVACPRCHRTAGANVGVSSDGRWTVVLV